MAYLASSQHCESKL